jgi:hypothetical protein
LRKAKTIKKSAGSSSETQDLIQQLGEGSFSSIYSLSMSVIAIYDTENKNYAYIGPNTKDVLGEELYTKMHWENQYFLSLCSKKYRPQFQKMLEVLSDKKYAGMDPADFRFSVNLPVMVNDSERIFLVRISRLPEKAMVLLSIGDFTNLSSFSSIILTIEKKEKENEYTLFEKKEFPLNDNTPLLSPREEQIHALVKQGKKSKEISDELQLSIHTVITIRRNIQKKLHSHD